jgi:hypothetical protein
MTLDRSARGRRGGAKLVVMCALLVASTASCDRRYSHGRIPVDDDTKHRWDAGEKEAENAGKKIDPIAPDTKSPGEVPTATLATVLAHLDSSERHGAGDKRFLSVAAKGGPPRATNILAEIILVKGSEYKSESDFRKGWIPVAKVYRPQFEGRSEETYDKLNLSPSDSSWVFVREQKDSTWVGSIVRLVGKSYVQNRLVVTMPKPDALEPVIGARFAWQDDDEAMWAYCGGKCCRMVAFK